MYFGDDSLSDFFMGTKEAQTISDALFRYVLKVHTPVSVFSSFGTNYILWI